MKWLMLTLALAQAVGVACSQAQQAQTKVQRRPLEKQPHEYSSPAGYEWREKGYDPKTKEPVTYDHKPRVELVDAKTGKYAFKWVGYDGKEKSVIIQRADAVDVIISAAVSRTSEEQYLYTYKVESLPSSGVHLSGVILQNFAPDAKPVEVNGRPTNDRDLSLLDGFRNTPSGDIPWNLENVAIGQMSNLIEQFREGSWISFGLLPDFNPKITPGRSLEVKIRSSAPPGLVGARAVGGDLESAGADEHMPFVLENRMPGYGELPRGYTVGPDERLKALPPAEKVKYLLDRLPQFHKLGWITKEMSRCYEQHLRGGDFGAVFRRVDQDLKAEQITTEVFAIIQATGIKT